MFQTMYPNEEDYILTEGAISTLIKVQSQSSLNKSICGIVMVSSLFL